MADLFSPPAPRRASTAQVHLRLLATTDLHAQLMPWDYMADAPASLGLAHLAPLIRALRQESANTLLLDNGDFLQGSPLSDWHDRYGSGAHPMITAMNALGYDAGTLGNHEFSHGLAHLQSALAAARFPVVSANLSRSDGGPLVPPYVTIDRDVIDRNGQPRRLRIAITGFAPPQTTRWESLRLNGAVQSEDILAAAQRTLARIAAERPDLTIALCHSGIAGHDPHPDMENAAIPLAQHPQIDVMVTGHTHLVFPDRTSARPMDAPDPNGAVDDQRGSLHGKPAVMAGFFGSHLGVIDLVLTQGTAGWAVVAHSARALQAPALPASDPLLARLAASAHAATLTGLRRPLGHTRRSLHSHFALVAPCVPLQLVAQAQRAHWQSRLPPDLARLPLLVAVAPFRTGGRGGPSNFTQIPPGPILKRHIADIYGHPDTPVLLLLDGTEVADWLERAAILFHRIPQGATDAPLIRSDVPGFDFDLIDGLSYRIDLSQPPRFDAKGCVINPASRRITGLSMNGAPFDPAGRYLLATNSYRAGSGIFPGTSRPPVACSDTPIADLLAAHIASLGKVDLTAETHWGFCPMKGTSVTLDTGPEAQADSSGIAHFHPVALGPTPAGFLRFRLSL